ncbi:MAG: hypothetical protein V4556_07730 [Bacteroidota bacterium]
MKSTAIPYFLSCAICFVLLSTSLFTYGQVSKKDQQKILSLAWFIESANNSINSLSGLLKKDNYRNKISALNNPANSELGFNLKNETVSALEPILGKTKKTDHRKFSAVIGNLLTTPEESGLMPIAKYIPAVSLFSTVLSLVGNLAISEKRVTNEDLNAFILRTRQYFTQYEKLNTINENFATDIEALLSSTDDTRNNLKTFLIECIITMDNSVSQETLNGMSMEALMQKYYDPQKLQVKLDTTTSLSGESLYPPDAATTVKMLGASLKKLQKEFESMYTNNYKALKELTASLKTTVPGINQEKLAATNEDIDRLYNDSRQSDIINLNIVRLDERMNIVCRMVNGN